MVMVEEHRKDKKHNRTPDNRGNAGPLPEKMIQLTVRNYAESNCQSRNSKVLARKRRKAMGDDTLFNTLGSDRCVKTLVVKVRRAWNCETMSTWTLKT